MHGDHLSAADAHPPGARYQHRLPTREEATELGFRHFDRGAPRGTGWGPDLWRCVCCLRTPGDRPGQCGQALAYARDVAGARSRDELHRKGPPRAA